MRARSRADTWSMPRTARSIAWEARAPAAESIAALMFGPDANATPQAHIAHDGSSRSPSWKERMASSWLKAHVSRSPWLKYRWAWGLRVVISYWCDPRLV